MSKQPEQNPPSVELGVPELSAVAAELTPVDRRRMTTRLVHWRRRPVWSLHEACDVAYGVLPAKPFRQLVRNTAHAEHLFGCAVNATKAGGLVVMNAAAPSNEWLVRKEEFQRWVVEQTELIGKDRADFLRRLYAQAEDGSSTSHKATP